MHPARIGGAVDRLCISLGRHAVQTASEGRDRPYAFIVVRWTECRHSSHADSALHEKDEYELPGLGLPISTAASMMKQPVLSNEAHATYPLPPPAQSLGD